MACPLCATNLFTLVCMKENKVQSMFKLLMRAIVFSATARVFAENECGVSAELHGLPLLHDGAAGITPVRAFAALIVQIKASSSLIKQAHED